MKITTNLLRQFGNINATDEEIIRLSKEHIAEVEEQHNLKSDYENIVIAEIVEKELHPDSDKLGIYQITTDGTNKIQVVAGDRALEVGDKVAYIQPGAIVPYSIYTEEEPVVIKSVKLRGVESNGMLGSERELNIGSNHTEVLKLSKDAPVGENFSKYYFLEDTAFSIENKGLTNRGDLFGVIGLARELTAITGNKFTSPDWFLDHDKNLTPETNCLNLQITNNAEVLCPRYTAVAMDNVNIKESPIEIKSALIKCGIKPINNIVDITNYISLIFGQPMHAFDYDKIVANDQSTTKTANIEIRLARDGENILGLDNKIHELNDKTIVIADSTHPIAIAGVIGGQDTEVDFNTKRIIFESANFDKNSVRKTSMELGLATDSCTKNKHSLDTEMTLPALKKAVSLAKELADAKIASNIVDIYPTPFDTNQTIKFDLENFNTIAGIEMNLEQVKSILENLEYKVTESEDRSLIVFVPSWRRDVVIKQDIYEDIVRVYGYNNIPAILPKKDIKPPLKNKVFELKKEVRDILSNRGANEIVTYSFTSLKNFQDCNLNPDEAYRILNSLSPELSLMRTSLLQSILQKGKENMARGFDKFVLFEQGISHLRSRIDENNLPEEEWMLSLLLTNAEKNEYIGSPYYEVKKYLADLLDSLNYSNIKYTLIADMEEEVLPPRLKNILPMFDPNVSAVVSIGMDYIGIVGEVKDSLKDAFKLPQNTAAFELSLTYLSTLEKSSKKYRDIPIYPPFSVDMCFKVDSSVIYSDLYNEIEFVINKENYYGKIECLDIYQDNEKEKKITFRITVSNYNSTFSNKEINIIKEQIVKKLAKKYSAEIV